MNEHQWRRRLHAKLDPEFLKILGYPQETSFKYSLTRILDKDGQPTVHWDTWLEHMQGKTFLVYDSDDSCKRRCMLSGRRRATCTKCHEECSGSERIYGDESMVMV